MVNGVVVLEGWRCGVTGVVLKSMMKIGEGQRVREDQWHGTKGVGVWYDFVHGRGAMMIEDRIIKVG